MLEEPGWHLGAGKAVLFVAVAKHYYNFQESYEDQDAAVPSEPLAGSFNR